MNKNVKKQLNSVLINDYTQSYRNYFWTVNNGKIIKKRQSKTQKMPYSFTKRPYKSAEKKMIIRKLSQIPKGDRMRAMLMEKLDMQQFMLSNNHILGDLPIMKQLNKDFPKSKRLLIRKMLLNHVKEIGGVVYGGYAINEYLSDDLKIYSKDTMFTPDLVNTSMVFPDVDVFTKKPRKHLIDFAKSLKEDGFKYIEVKPGMHSGTWKLYVNFINICDFTKPDQGIPYKSIRGVRYASVDFLKAQLYKILSDPSGDVSIWSKTAQRLERLEHSINMVVAANPNIIFDSKSKYQRFVTDFYGPVSKARKIEKMKVSWDQKNLRDSLKKTYDLKKVSPSKINYKNANVVQVMKKSKNVEVPWSKNMIGIRLK